MKMLNNVSKRDLAVIAFVAEHRVVTSRHIQAVYFTRMIKNSSQARSARRLLRKLNQNKYLQRLNTRRYIGGTQFGSVGYVYVLGHNATRLGYHINSYIKSPSKLAHSLLITDVAITLQLAKAASRYSNVSIQLEPYCWRSYISPAGFAQSLRPDMFVIADTPAYTDYWFIEIDRATEHMPVILRKCTYYQQYFLSGEEQQKYTIFPVIIWLVPTKRRQASIEVLIKNTTFLEQRLFRVIVIDEWFHSNQ